MKNKGLILFFAAVFIFISEGNSQIATQSNLRAKRIKIVADTTVVDSFSIVPRTFSILGINDSVYQLDYFNSLLIFKNRAIIDSVDVVYRVFPYKIKSVTQHLKYENVMNRFYVKPFEFNKREGRKAEQLFDFGDVQYNGSFGRSITTGNNQDVVLNSNFNLSINGVLGDSIEINAAITDNNIPIQPDGTTQQLNEFDQIYLQFKKRNWKLSLGDIDIREKQHYFLNFYKRMQGASFESNNSFSKTLVSASIAKGKFTRNVFQGLEGNQGPYRLKNDNNELYFILLAGTERVFINGELMQRGDDQDYVINYNTAEIIFTTQQTITKDSRIQVEFEYADRNYLNTNIYVAQAFQLNKKLSLSFAAFDNSDVKHSQLNQVLNEEQKSFLNRLGDSIQKAFYPSAIVDTSFDVDKILYEKNYFNTGSTIDSFYQYSQNPATAKYRLSFTDMGEGNGNYVTNFIGANGRVYKFLPKIGGVKQGRFEPILLLITPKKQQLITLASSYKINANSELRTEIAISNTDVNRFSKFESGDDFGKAAKFSFYNNSNYSNRSLRKMVLKTTFDYEYVQDKFKPLERLRQVEFLRDWGIQNQQAVVSEHIFQTSVKLYDEQNNSISYQFSNYNRSDQYRGFQQKLFHVSKYKNWKFNNQYFLSSFNYLENKGLYHRPIIDISRELRKLNGYWIGLRYTNEKQQTNNKISDSLSKQSFSFSTYSVYLKSTEKNKNKFAVTYFSRVDKYPVGTKFIVGDKSSNLNIQSEISANPKHQFYFNSTFRKLLVVNSISKQKSDETILGRMEYIINEWKGLLTGNLLYELGTGQEQKRDFIFLEVPAGTGQFAWRDYNNDGVQQLNEFEEALFLDQAKYIKIYTPSNEFIKANFTTFNYSFRLNPKSILNNVEINSFKKLLSKTVLSSSLQVNKKSIAFGNVEFNPFKNQLSDTALITLNTISVQTLSFNRFSNRWGFDLSFLKNSGKYLLTYGYESKQIQDLGLKIRWNIDKFIMLDMAAKSGFSGLYSPKFSNRNYELTIYNLEPKIVFINGTQFRIATSYKYEKTKNSLIYGGENAVANSLQLESKYNVLQNSSVTGKLALHKIQYPFATNSTVSYIMLNGLLPGNNYLWGLDFTKRIFTNMELSFQYEGRKPGEARTIHIGRASIKMLF